LSSFVTLRSALKEQSAIESTIRGDPNLECSAGPFAPGFPPALFARSRDWFDTTACLARSLSPLSPTTQSRARGEFLYRRKPMMPQEERRRGLLQRGFTPQANYDAADRRLRTAKARLEAAELAKKDATERLGYTELRSDDAGVVTAVGAQVGQVVSAGQMIVFKSILCRKIALGMIRARHQLAPAVPVQEVVDRAVAGFVLDRFLVGRLEIMNAQHLAGAG
jgi:hypothetical protein